MTHGNRIQTELDTTGRFDVYFQLTKVDLEKREVWGRATQEKPDRAREIMDYGSSKPLFQRWSNEALKRTAILPPDARSLGNMREMHEPIAAGKVIAIDFNDVEKAIDIGTVCTNDSTWEKIANGTLTGFSIGGGYARRWYDPTNPTCVRYTADPVEISYVDSPMLPDATFKMIKADGVEELHKMGDPIEMVKVEVGPKVDLPGLAGAVTDEIDQQTPQVIEDDILNFTRPAVVASGEAAKAIPTVGNIVSPTVADDTRAVQPISSPRSDPVEKLAEVVEKLAAQVNELVSIGKIASGEREKAEHMLKTVGERVGIPRRDGSPVAPAPDYPTDPNLYADPANWQWPLDEARLEPAIARFNKGDDLSRYSVRERHILGRRIALKASTLAGGDYRYSPQTQTIQKHEVQMTDPNVVEKVDLAPLLSQISAGMSAAADQIAKNPSAAKDLLMQLVGSIDTVSTANPDNPSGAPTGEQQGATEATLKAASATGSEGGSGTPPSKTPESEKPSMDKEADVETDTATAGTSDEAYKAVLAEVKKLNETVARLVAQKEAAPAPAPVAEVEAAAEPAPAVAAPAVEKAATIPQNLPAELSAILAAAQQEEGDPIIKALTSGDRHALMKAAQLAGTEERPDPQAVLQHVQKAVQASLNPIFTTAMLAKGYANMAPTFPAPDQK